MQKILNYINGELIEPKSGNYLDNYNPAEGKVYSQVPDSDGFDVHHATVAARKAFCSWSSMPVNQRSSILQNIAAVIDRDLEKMVPAESIDNGMPFQQYMALD